MNIMNKRGTQDNIVTYEHYCDTKADLANIPKNQITLGSVAIVLKDDDDSMGIYMANSNKEWISFSSSGSGGGSSMGDISLANLVDVSLANPADGDTLVYDATSEKWVAQAGGGSNGDGMRFVEFSIEWIEGQPSVTFVDTYEEILNLLTNGKLAGAVSVTNDGTYKSYMYYKLLTYNNMENRITFLQVFPHNSATVSNKGSIECRYIYIDSSNVATLEEFILVTDKTN